MFRLAADILGTCKYQNTEEGRRSNIDEAITIGVADGTVGHPDSTSQCRSSSTIQAEAQGPDVEEGVPGPIGVLRRPDCLWPWRGLRWQALPWSTG